MFDAFVMEAADDGGGEGRVDWRKPPGPNVPGRELMRQLNLVDSYSLNDGDTRPWYTHGRI